MQRNNNHEAPVNQLSLAYRAVLRDTATLNTVAHVITSNIKAYKNDEGKSREYIDYITTHWLMKHAQRCEASIGHLSSCSTAEPTIDEEWEGCDLEKRQGHGEG